MYATSTLGLTPPNTFWPKVDMLSLTLGYELLKMTHDIPLLALISSVISCVSLRYDSLQQPPDVDARRRLHSTDSLTLTLPTTRRRTVGDRAFPCAASRAWNQLPSVVGDSLTLLTFRTFPHFVSCLGVFGYYDRRLCCEGCPSTSVCTPAMST